jgi:hypothetical protein
MGKAAAEIGIGIYIAMLIQIISGSFVSAGVGAVVLYAIIKANCK